MRGDQLVTNLPAAEVARPLKKIVTDLATKRVKVNKLMKTDDMIKYVREDLGKAHLPDFTKARSSERSLDEIPTSEFAKIRTTGAPARRRLDPSDRKEVVPKGCPVNVTDNRIAEIYKELRTLKLEDGPAAAPNAIAVLLRVFLEMSVDHFLEHNGGSLKDLNPDGSNRWKTLNKKLKEVIAMLVANGVPETKLASILRSVDVKTSPMNVELFHLYVHETLRNTFARRVKSGMEQCTAALRENLAMNEPDLRRLIHFTPLRYPGGKAKLAEYVKEIIRANKLYDGEYVEPYAGGAAIGLELLFQEYVTKIHVNDLSVPVYSFWKAVLNDTEELCRLVKNTRVSVASWDRQKRIFANPRSHSYVQLGFATFFLNRTNRSGILNGGIIGGRDQTGPWKIDARYNAEELAFRIESIAKMGRKIMTCSPTSLQS